MALDLVLLDVALEVVVDLLGGLAQGQLAQRDQVASAEEVAERLVDLLGVVDRASLQPVDERVGRQVDELDLVGLVEHAIGHRLAHAHAGDLADGVVEALEVLDVDGREHVDAGVEELLDGLPALLVRGAGHVGVRELVDEHGRGLARDDRVGVELRERRAVVLDAPWAARARARRPARPCRRGRAARRSR